MKKILVVDDDKMFLHMYKSNAKLLFHGENEVETILAENGAQGFQKAIQEIPDLVLMDLEMPVMDGIEAAQKLRDEEKTAEIPLILITSHGEDEVEQHKHLFDWVVKKPIDEKKLSLMAQKFLGIQLH